MKNNSLLLILLVLLILFFISYLHYSFSILKYPFDWDPSEGYICYHILNILDGKPCYYIDSDYPAYYVYPPFFLFTVLPLKLVLNDILLCSRLISFLASLCIGAVLYFWARKISSDNTFVPVITALFFFAPGITSFWLPLGRVDTLAQLFMLFGIYLCIYNPQKSFRWFAGILFLTFATFTKQTGIFGVLIVFTVTLCESSLKALKFFSWIFFLHLVIFGLIFFWAGKPFFENIFGTYMAQPYEYQLLKYYFRSFFVCMPIFISIGIYGSYLFLKKKIHLQIVIFFILCVISTLLVAKRGSSWNLLIPFTLGLSLICGVTIRELDRKLQNFVYLLLIIQILLLAVYNPLYVKYPNDNHRESGYKILEYVKNHSGPLLTEQFETFANRFGKTIFVEGDLGYELFAANKWNAKKLVQDIVSQNFSLVLFTGEGGFVQPVKDALREYYVPVDRLSIGLYSGERYLYILEPKYVESSP
ncbi:MAG: hypothetical protein A2161_15620 [Candidatus Schekmanbacteria bacterium RBG_13_48_7]|uniref:Glycosyltransferase RgtA/B/C/D-like domain-containing protein n=1 Tax=Candidatus Schekmanbacteria bacterium RBG_13_48_7 TaxID=1817878 RepID=A0A1F7RM66_9BACT|nr:MAG: hypothetical protein A2161_15620 [Candidatus Schekmanbacteria bacterium RBG_13_48_7]